jgi:uncharacterized protein YhbP (UPF0306 family)
MNPHSILKEFLTGSTLMQLATVGDDGPWVCNLYFVADEDDNLYWTSARSRRHSKEILKNPQVAATIVHDADRKQAVQITGEAFDAWPHNLEHINALYAQKFGDKPARMEEVMANTPEGRAYWMLKPTHIELWDEVNFPDNPKQQII